MVHTSSLSVIQTVLKLMTVEEVVHYLWKKIEVQDWTQRCREKKKWNKYQCIKHCTAVKESFNVKCVFLSPQSLCGGSEEGPKPQWKSAFIHYICTSLRTLWKLNTLNLNCIASYFFNRKSNMTYLKVNWVCINVFSVWKNFCAPKLANIVDTSFSIDFSCDACQVAPVKSPDQVKPYRDKGGKVRGAPWEARG